MDKDAIPRLKMSQQCRCERDVRCCFQAEKDLKGRENSKRREGGKTGVYWEGRSGEKEKE